MYDQRVIHHSKNLGDKMSGGSTTITDEIRKKFNMPRVGEEIPHIDEKATRFLCSTLNRQQRRHLGYLLKIAPDLSIAEMLEKVRGEPVVSFLPNSASV